MKIVFSVFLLFITGLMGLSGAPFYGSKPAITGGLGFTLGDRGKNGPTRCAKRFRNFKKCYLKVTPDDRQIYFIEASYAASSPLDARKEYTVTVEALRKKYYPTSNRSVTSRPVKLRSDLVYTVRIGQREIICRRTHNQVTLTYIDHALARQQQMKKSARQTQDLTSEVAGSSLDAI